MPFMPRCQPAQPIKDARAVRNVQTPRPSQRQAAAPLACDEQAKEIARLKREVDHLRMERDILKKTVSIISGPVK
jgi:hypothetical protein